MEKVKNPPIHTPLDVISRGKHRVPNINEAWTVCVMNTVSKKITKIGEGENGVKIGLGHTTNQEETIVFTLEETYVNEVKTLTIKSCFFGLSAEDFDNTIICDN